MTPGTMDKDPGRYPAREMVWVLSGTTTGALLTVFIRQNVSEIIIVAELTAMRPETNYFINQRQHPLNFI